MPEDTLHAFADHGDATRDFIDSIGVDAETLRRAEYEGVNLAAITSYSRFVMMSATPAGSE